MAHSHWLVKTEPSTYSFQRLVEEGGTRYYRLRLGPFSRDRAARLKRRLRTPRTVNRQRALQTKLAASSVLPVPL